MSLPHPLAHAQPAGSGCRVDAVPALLGRSQSMGVIPVLLQQQVQSTAPCGCCGDSNLVPACPSTAPLRVCASLLYRSTYQHKNHNVAPVILAINPYKENRDLSNVCWVKVLILKFLMRKFLFIGMYYFVILGAWVILIYVHKIVP